MTTSFKNSKSREIYSVGHSRHPLGTFIALLQQHGITALADVRSIPSSRFNPQFNKVSLEREIRAHGINYVFLGRELGARPKDPSLYANGQVKFDRIKATALFKEGINRVVWGLEQHRIALMCAEKDPGNCHRAILIAPALNEHGVEVVHILADGGLESQENLMKRLPDKAGAAQEDLFGPRESLALDRQELRVAYRNKEQKISKRQNTP